MPSTSTAQWQIPLAMQIVPSALLFLAALCILPESPRFLVLSGQTHQARTVLSFIRHLPLEHTYINAELDEISSAISRQHTPIPSRKKSRFGIWTELGWKGNRNRVCIGLGLMIGQNLTGINGVNFYTPVIFRSIGFEGTKVVLLASGLPLIPFLFLFRVLGVLTG